MKPGRRLLAVLVAVPLVVAAALLAQPPAPARSQAPDVLLNVIRSGTQKLNLFVPDFTVTGAPDTNNLSRSLADVAGNDLKFTNLFNVVGNQPALPPGNAEAMKKAWTLTVFRSGHSTSACRIASASPILPSG